MAEGDRSTLICLLKGGLGNQLFQYACALNLARKFNLALAFDTTILKGGDSMGRHVEIDKMFAEPLQSALITASMPVLRESSPANLAAELRTLLDQGAAWIAVDGYFQSEDYFIEVRDEIKAALLKFRERHLGKEHLPRHTVAAIGLHLRRHDYQHLGLCADEYYIEAVNWFLRKFGDNIQFYLFTDEPAYSVNLFEHHVAATKITLVCKGSGLSDLLWLSTCDHFVIANSTFSWWAAYIGEREDSIIFAPRAPWVLHLNIDPAPARWCKVEGVVSKHGEIADAARKICWARFSSNYFRFQESWNRLNDPGLLAPKPDDLFPCLDDEISSHPLDPHYLYHTGWAARKLGQYGVKEHYDFGSSLMFSTIASAFTRIVFHDFRSPNILLPGLACRDCDLLQLDYPNDSLTSVSCMHTIEHVGLGRYGDQINAQGDHIAARELIRVLQPGGLLFFVVPVGRARLQFNAHRIYSFGHVMALTVGLDLIEHSLIPDNAMSVGMIDNASPDLINQQNHGCGCFVFRKPL